MSREDRQFAAFATALAVDITAREPALTIHPESPQRVLATRPDTQTVSMDLTPVQLTPQQASAEDFFCSVESSDDLLQAYASASSALPLEWDDPEAMSPVDDYALEFRNRLLLHAATELNDHEAREMAQWLGKLDIYAAVKALEALVNHPHDRALLRIATEQGWTVHLDHLAIRCGSEDNHAAQRVVQMLEQHHGYTPSQITSEACYRFDDGWDAYPLYKLLENGRMIRLFVDESSRDNQVQIIQHWNRVYGFTAHHLAMRAFTTDSDGRHATPLHQIMQAMGQAGVETMTPTGDYTSGLLEQVFTRPTHTPDVPPAITTELAHINPELPRQVENGKLIELVTRREMPPAAAEQLFDLYHLDYSADDPDHSAPLYHYFLPAQAAHVIHTSVQTA
jgi:hypothetical protein